MPTLDGVTVKGSGTVVTAFSIDRMTIDLFQFWLEYDWLFLTHDLLNIETKPIVYDQETERYIRYQPIVWLDDNNPVAVTIITWAQMRSDEIRVEIRDGRDITDRIVAWAKNRRWIMGDVDHAQTLRPAPVDDLTDKEREVARLLAAKLSYVEIANRQHVKIGTIKTHINAIAKKWGVRAIYEILWIEAQKRLY